MPDIRTYPQGSGDVKSRFIGGVLVTYGVALQARFRITLAQLNAGFTLLAALANVKWALLDFAMIAVGGAATTATSANIIGTSAGSAVQLAVVAVAALTQSALVRAGAANAVILADGASFVPMDVNTAITCKTVGSAMTVLTNLDVTLSYVASQG